MQKPQEMGIFLRGTRTHIDLSMINPSDSAWFSRALQESFHHKAGKKSNKLKTVLYQIYFNLIKMENNLKIVTNSCCANSFLRIQSFRFIIGRVLELKYYCEKVFE